MLEIYHAEPSAAALVAKYSQVHERLMGSRAHPVRRPPRVMAVEDLPKPVTSVAIIRMVASNHRIGAKEITSGSRREKVVAARDEAIRLMFEHTNLSLVRIGSRVGRNHSTVIYSLFKQGLVAGTPIMRKRLAARVAG